MKKKTTHTPDRRALKKLKALDQATSELSASAYFLMGFSASQFAERLAEIGLNHPLTELDWILPILGERLARTNVKIAVSIDDAIEILEGNEGTSK